MTIRAARFRSGDPVAIVPRRTRRPKRFSFSAALAVLALLGCAPLAASEAHGSRAALPSPPPDGRDPYAAHIAEAALRFGIPEAWIRAVMRVESAGNPSATSHAGAMGLMQVMPGTYAELRARHGLGPNPYDPRDSILAGAAYLREMHDRYGSAGFLAAYNAGPGRWEDYAYRGRRLPTETVAYMARLGPMIGGSAAPSAPIVTRADVVSWTRSALFAVPRADNSPAEQLPNEDQSDGVRSAALESPSSADVAQNQIIATAQPHPLFAIRRAR